VKASGCQNQNYGSTLALTRFNSRIDRGAVILLELHPDPPHLEEIPRVRLIKLHIATNPHNNTHQMRRSSKNDQTAKKNNLRTNQGVYLDGVGDLEVRAAVGHLDAGGVRAGLAGGDVAAFSNRLLGVEVDRV